MFSGTRPFWMRSTKVTSAALTAWVALASSSASPQLANADRRDDIATPAIIHGPGLDWTSEMRLIIQPAS